MSGERFRARLAPVLAAAAPAAVYVIVSPPSRDLAAHLFRARLFALQGFGLWDNLWYAGHDILGYSVVFPAVSAALTPQLAAALAATATAALFMPLAARHAGDRAWPAAVVFGAATAIDLYTGRLALAFGALPALAAILALDGGATAAACALAVAAALCSPVAALFAALAAAGCAIAALATRRAIGPALPGAAVAVAALAPVGLLALTFPEGGVEPFALSAMWPVATLAVAVAVLGPGDRPALRAGAAVYATAVLVAYAVPSPVGGNIARLGELLAAPVAALLWWPRRPRLLAAAALPLLYLGWQAPARDVAATAGDPSVTAAYYRPLLSFLTRASAPPSPPFRIEIPFTASHWESYRVATRFAIARGWERQLDIADNPIFYRGPLTADTYRAWLHANAVRFVAVPDAALDGSARRERALVERGPSYLREVMATAHWRVYAVTDATPIASGAAVLRSLGTDAVTLVAGRPGTVNLRVRFSPYWALGEGAGCVSPDGPDTRLTVRRAGVVRLVMRFAIGRIGATTPRCTSGT
jgi:hypothetical protein